MSASVFTRFVALIVTSLICSSLVVAQTPAPVALKSSGTLKTVNIAAGQNMASAYVVSVGNISQLVDFVVEAPPGTIVTAKALAFKGDVKKAIKKKSGWYNLTFQKDGEEVSSLKVAGSSSSGPTFNPNPNPSNDNNPGKDFYCLAFTREYLDKLIEAIREYSGQVKTRDEICAMYTPTKSTGSSNNTSISNGTSNNTGSSTPQVATQGLNATAVVHKDTCSGNRESKYLVKFELNFARTGGTARKNGFSITVAARDIDYKGSMAAALKPVSDGMFFPKALFLMSTTGAGFGAYGEKANVFRWKKGKPSQIAELKVENYLYYKGKFLGRIVAEPAIRGGRGTVEMHGSNIYSVCFSLAKRRQNLNGY